MDSDKINDTFRARAEAFLSLILTGSTDITFRNMITKRLSPQEMTYPKQHGQVGRNVEF